MVSSLNLQVQYLGQYLTDFYELTWQLQED